MFYLRNVEREIRADKDVRVVENLQLKRELETLQNDLDRNRGSKYRTRRGGGGGGGILIWLCSILEEIKSEDFINQFTVFLLDQSTRWTPPQLYKSINTSLHNILIVTTQFPPL